MATGRSEDSAETNGKLELGRTCFKTHDWTDAFDAFCAADQISPLNGADMELLSLAAYLSGRDGEYLKALERAHHAHAAEGNSLRAVRCAFWLGMRLGQRGEFAHSSGWFSRAERLLQQETEDCAERGYLMLPTAEKHRFAGNFDGARADAAEIAAIGDRFGDADLSALARHLQGRCLLVLAHVEEGLALLDDTMLSVTSGALSPLVTGVVYCGVIEGCRQVYALDRAREWTSALTAWCAAQNDPFSFTGTCMVHRAEILQMQGAWTDALQEARNAAETLTPGDDPQAFAAAHYQIGEMHRLRGAYADAEAAYRMSAQTGWEPQPGLALLRLAQGQGETARTVLGRAIDASDIRVVRARLLPAWVEILVALNDIPAADEASSELETIAGAYGTPVVRALADNARGAVLLAEGNAAASVPFLRRALQEWQRNEAPYLAARVRVLLAEACNKLGDVDGAALALESARQVFEQLGAVPDITRMTATTRPHGLTAREAEVLVLIAAGKTNRTIADDLGVSTRTIDRHVSNLFTKLDVPSRAAATAFAYQHKLV